MTTAPTIYDLIVRSCVQREEWPAEVVELSQSEVEKEIDDFLREHPVTDNKARTKK